MADDDTRDERDPRDRVAADPIAPGRAGASLPDAVTDGDDLDEEDSP